MELVLSFCKQIHKAGYLSSVLHIKVFTPFSICIKITLCTLSFVLKQFISLLYYYFFRIHLKIRMKINTGSSTLCYVTFFLLVVPLKVGQNAISFGSRLLMMVFKGIAPGENRKALSSLDISTKTFADDLLQLAFSLNQQVSLFQRVLNEIVLEL